MNIPEGWKNVTIGDLIPEKCVEEIEKLLNKYIAGELKSPDIHTQLVDALKPHETELMEKGVVVAYLAYAIESAGHHMKEAKRAKGQAEEGA